MAEEQDRDPGHQANVLAAAFPAPPPFYKHFTPENLARLKQIQNPQQIPSNSPSTSTFVSQRTPPKSPAEDKDPLPAELRCLIPPPPPTTGPYRSFGDQFQLNETLPALAGSGIEQLYPSSPSAAGTPSANTSTQKESDENGTSPGWTLDRAFYLKKIAKSLLLNFMELIGVLSVDPAQYARKIEDLRILFINAHHLLNEYRPHQARETLILMMEEQLERSRRETADMKQMKEKVEAVLAGLEIDVAGGASADTNLGKIIDAEERGRSSLQETEAARVESEERRVWDVLDRELGL
ncbi:MAG: hypothetical protein M4579_002244 [Chaenotheca gracillima]|nr:MAG: hypothetical protein M4579_002244 [Chaenotheca gracillima]